MAIFFEKSTHVFSSYDLWVANYTKGQKPVLPKPWDNWSFWQISSKAQVPGVKSPVDLNLFNGDADKLEDYSIKVNKKLN
ncbi:GH25 family lysozyme [Piscirickettsia litoralis]|uniref:GH25 family lysozyme n=1 Tax=Piscirickettsia litoralis TaxID=1891921 RepID=UPI0009810B2F